MSNRAWVTLATNDSYSLGALVLAHSLRRVNSTYPAVILVTPAVTDAMRDRLQAVFSEVVTVDVLDSQDAAHLALLQRPELGITFTKIHCWNLVQYEKCVFLDADALVVQNCDELFEREELSAAPDVGWPDCFNSGVFVYRPSKETFEALIKFAKERGSFDGGDQGLLNSFFSSWARGDINKHLPFLYNVTSAAFYSYIPALKHYGQDLKIIHFIGASKPWLHAYNWESQSVDAADHLKDNLQLWWNIFVSSVHTQLDTCMDNAEVPPELPPSDVTQALYYEPVVDQSSEFPWHQNRPHQCEEQESEIQIEPCFDPWDLYGGNIPPMPDVGEYREKEREDSKITDDVRDYIWKYKAHEQHYSQSYQQQHSHTYIDNHNHESLHSQGDYESHHAFSNEFTKPYTMHQTYHIHVEPTKGEDESVISNDHVSEGGYEDWRPRHPYDGFYLRHRAMFDYRGRKVCTHELPPTPPRTPPPESPQLLPVEVDTLSESQASFDEHSGVAGNLARVTPGASGSRRDAIDELTRRQGWEAGNIDYMGADSFDNIWAKISQTLNESSSQNVTHPKEPSPPPKEPSPPREDVAVIKAVERKNEESAVTIEAKPAEEAVVQKEPPPSPAEKSIPPNEPTVGVSKAPLETVPTCEELIKPKTPVRQDSKSAAGQQESEATTPMIPTPLEQSKGETTAAAPAARIADTPATPESPVSQKALNLTGASTDSPPLANTPSKEEAPSPPTAKSGERARPAHKLLLSPPIASDPLPTPDSELEDAATLAQKIIASEIATPTITSPSPPAAFSATSPLMQTEKSLIVATPELDTPPAAGLVSLAQIGVKPKAKPSTAALIESSVAETPAQAPSASSKSGTEPTKKKVVKKIVKKESTAAAGETPVPPPRKKEKKPKDK